MSWFFLGTTSRYSVSKKSRKFIVFCKMVAVFRSHCSKVDDWMTQLISIAPIQWIMIFPVDNAIKFLNNFSQFPFSWILISEFRIPEVGAFHTKNSWFSGLQNLKALAMCRNWQVGSASVQVERVSSVELWELLMAIIGHHPWRAGSFWPETAFSLVELALSICELAAPVRKMRQIGKRRKLSFIWNNNWKLNILHDSPFPSHLLCLDQLIVNLYSFQYCFRWRRQRISPRSSWL